MASEWGAEVLALKLCFCVVRSCPSSTLQRSPLLWSRVQIRAPSCGTFFITLDGIEVWTRSLPASLQPALHCSCLELLINPRIQFFGESLGLHGWPNPQGKSLVEVSSTLLEIAQKGQSWMS